ncbi:MAG: hypothetical protein AB7O65_15055 [Candidatus Korobacteraceae bacterium]
MPPKTPQQADPDAHKGAVESDESRDATPVSIAGQLPHRTSNSLVKDNDTDFPGPDGAPEHSGQEESNNPVTDDNSRCA